MASDISLAVGDGARRMTYAELAAVRGISPASAKRLTQRHRWGRQMGNDGVVRVTVPFSALVSPSKPVTTHGSPSPATGAADPVMPTAVADDVARDIAPDDVGDVTPATTALVRGMEVLREQLAKADRREEAQRQRAEDAERRLDNERQLVAEGRNRIDELFSMLEVSHGKLADAVAAQRIAADEAAALRAEADRRREWRLLRRLRWAIRRS